MKRSPLKRSKPLRRRQARRVARKTDAEREFTAWIHTQRCHCWFITTGPADAQGMAPACSGPIEQSHLRHQTGLGRKESDLKSVPMCSRHHALWEQHAGPFNGLTKMQRFALMTGWIEEVHQTYRRETGKEIVCFYCKCRHILSVVAALRKEGGR